MAKKKSGLGTDAFYQQPTPVSQQADKSLEQQTSTPALRAGASVPVSQQDDKPEKVKATFYFEPEVIDDLEAAQVRLRKLVGRTVSPAKRNQVSKSLIVELALRLALDELEEQGTDSRLAKEMSRL